MEFIGIDVAKGQLEFACGLQARLVPCPTTTVASGTTRRSRPWWASHRAAQPYAPQRVVCALRSHGDLAPVRPGGRIRGRPLTGACRRVPCHSTPRCGHPQKSSQPSSGLAAQCRTRRRPGLETLVANHPPSGIRTPREAVEFAPGSARLHPSASRTARARGGGHRANSAETRLPTAASGELNRPSTPRRPISARFDPHASESRVAGLARP
jgi:hypothetical protein